MKSKFKKTVILANIIALILLAIACDESNINKPQINGLPLMINPITMPYDSVGILHNQICDAIYQELLNKGLEGSLINSDAVEFYAYQAGINFLNSNFSEEYSSIVITQWDYMWNYSLNQNIDTSNLWTPEVDSLLTIAEKDILTQLKYVIDNGPDLSEILINIENLKISAQSTCTTDELLIILPALSVAEHSLTYWYDNLDDWYNIPHTMATQKDSSQISFKDGAKADIEGGVGGAVMGAMGGAAAGGVGAGPGALVGGLAGAAGNTAGYIVGKLLEHWWE